MELDALTSIIDDLVEAGPDAMCDASSIEALFRQAARLDAVVTSAVAAFDASSVWAANGARTVTAWLATRCRVPKGEVRRTVHRARALPVLRVAAKAWLAGDISGAHVGALAAIRREATAEALARDEPLLVGQAASLPFSSFARVLSYFDQLADPDGAEEASEHRRARRDVYLVESFSGTWLGGITLDPVSGGIVAGELSRLEDELFRSDWQQARDVLQRDPRPEELPRTCGQRRADALVEMATRSATAPADGRRPVPLFSVLVGYETMRGRICEMARGAVVTPGSLLPWLDEAIIERAVFGPGPRVEVSHTARLFSGATRRGIELRDRCCAHLYCDIPAENCEVDHVVPFSAGGPTTQENGRLLCGFHNRLRNQRPPPTCS